MKCDNCKLCLLIVRLDETDKSYFYWYCDLCHNVYRLEKGKKYLVTDQNLIDAVKLRYKESRE